MVSEQILKDIAAQIKIEVDLIRKGIAMLDASNRALSACETANKKGFEDLQSIINHISLRKMQGEDVAQWDEKKRICWCRLREAIEATNYVRNVRIPEVKEALHKLRNDLQKKIMFILSFVSSCESPDSKIIWN